MRVARRSLRPSASRRSRTDSLPVTSQGVQLLLRGMVWDRFLSAARSTLEIGHFALPLHAVHLSSFLFVMRLCRVAVRAAREIVTAVVQRRTHCLFEGRGWHGLVVLGLQFDEFLIGDADEVDEFASGWCSVDAGNVATARAHGNFDRVAAGEADFDLLEEVFTFDCNGIAIAAFDGSHGKKRSF